QPLAALALVRARRAGPGHIAQVLDGQLGSINTKPGEHSVQQLSGARASFDKRLDLRTREADICQNRIEGSHGGELRGLESQLSALAPAIDEARDRSPEILECRHDPILLH